LDGVDRRLDLVRPGLVALETLADKGLAFVDEVAVPSAAVLVGQQHEVAVRGRAGGPSRLDEQHEREQSHDLRFVGHELGQEPSEADGLGAKVLADELVARARTVAEDEVDDGQHGPKAVREVRLIRDPVRDPRVADIALGPDQPLGHGWLGYQEGARDLRGGEPSQEPERQRDLGAGGERRVTAGEDQAQPVVEHGALLVRFAARVQQRPGRAGPHGTPPGGGGRSRGCGRW
jgi:hypothetical protein